MNTAKIKNPTLTNNDYYKAIFFILIAYASIAGMGVFVKSATSTIPASEILFFRFFIGILLIIPFIIKNKQIHFIPSNLKYSILRNAAGLISMLFMFYSMKYLPVSTVVLLTNTSSLFIPLFIFILFKKKSTLSTILCTLVGFISICIILYAPQANLSVAYLFMGVLSAIFAALAYIGVKELSKSSAPLQIVFHFYLISAMTIPLFTAYHWVWPSWTEMLLLVMVGLFGLSFQIFLTKAFKLSPLTAITPFIFISVVLSAIFDWIFWEMAPSAQFWIGALVIVMSMSVLTKTQATTAGIKDNAATGDRGGC